MIPSSFRQIQETGRMQQQALLAAAERERRARQVVVAAPASEMPSARRESVGALDRLIVLRDRLALVVAAVLRPRVSQS
jgi:hypothetical protein